MEPLKLLLVEDDLASLELMSEVFKSLKADVVPLSDSQKAATLVGQQKFDGIFLDLEMPNMNGFQLAQKVRESSWNKTTPVIIVTGREKRDAMQQSFATGATFFLQKPIDRQKLTSLFRTVRGPLFENRRHYLRVPLQAELMCRVGPRNLRGRTWDISQGGLQVEVEGLNSGDPVHVSFRLPKSATVIDAFGETAWIKDGRQGIEFTKMSLSHQEQVREFIEQLEPVQR